MVSSAVVGIDPLYMGLAPVWAIPLAIRRASLAPEEIDVWEVHEAFSAQALGVLRELPNQLGGFTVPDDELTANGGAVASGHPFGTTGTRYVLTLATELRERNARYGVIGVCIGSGQGVAVVLENPSAGERSGRSGLGARFGFPVEGFVRAGDQSNRRVRMVQGDRFDCRPGVCAQTSGAARYLTLGDGQEQGALESQANTIEGWCIEHDQKANRGR